jgi:SpoU rRNA methylase family enzyme
MHSRKSQKYAKRKVFYTAQALERTDLVVFCHLPKGLSPLEIKNKTKMIISGEWRRKVHRLREVRSQVPHQA